VNWSASAEPPEGDFWECASCRAKPGQPTLCESCVHNRALLEHLKGELRRANDRAGQLQLQVNTADRDVAQRDAEIVKLRRALYDGGRVRW
jgi:hypothetical protein